MHLGTSNKCFNSLNRTVTDSGDYISKKKQTTLYQTLSNNISKYGIPSPLKNNIRYDDSFGVSNSGSNTLLYAKNYNLLLDVTKGKYFSNPILSGSAASASNEMWSGNTYLMDYSNNNINVLSGWNYGTLTSGSISSVTPITIPIIGGAGANPTSSIIDNSWNCAPGYTVDPDNTLFYNYCTKINKGSAWVKYIDISFQYTNYYWKAANAQPLQGMSFPSKISFDNQTSSTSNYLPDTSQTNYSVNEYWCKGANAIN